MSIKNTFKKYFPYIIFVLVSLGVGALSSLATSNNMDVFTKIARPPYTPPAIVFPIVWTVLYILMGIGAGRVYCSDAPDEKKKSAIGTYIVQLIINFFGAFFFFNFNAYLLSFLWAALLWVFVVLMAYRFFKVDKLAGYLQIPYVLWSTFATFLSLSIFLMNR